VSEGKVVRGNEERTVSVTRVPEWEPAWSAGPRVRFHVGE